MKNKTRNGIMKKKRVLFFSTSIFKFLDLWMFLRKKIVKFLKMRDETNQSHFNLTRHLEDKVERFLPTLQKSNKRLNIQFVSNKNECEKRIKLLVVFDKWGVSVCNRIKF